MATTDRQAHFFEHATDDAAIALAVRPALGSRLLSREDSILGLAILLPEVGGL